MRPDGSTDFSMSTPANVLVYWMANGGAFVTSVHYAGLFVPLGNAGEARNLLFDPDVATNTC